MGDRVAPAGLVVWLTGLSGAGKTTIAGGVADEFRSRGERVEQLDGDQVRRGASRGLGYSKADRDANVARVAESAAALAGTGTVVVVSLISPYAEGRAKARRAVEAVAPFVEVYVATPIEVCAQRDPKGLYAKAYAGEISDFTGLSSPYESPHQPDIRVDTSNEPPAASIAAVVAAIDASGVRAAAQQRDG